MAAPTRTASPAVSGNYLVFGDGMHQDAGGVLHCLTADTGLMRADTNAAAEAFREAVRRDTTNNEAKGRLRAIGRQ